MPVALEGRSGRLLMRAGSALLAVGLLSTLTACGEDPTDAQTSGPGVSASSTPTEEPTPTQEPTYEVPPDTDGDGVFDPVDEYPQDPTASTKASLTMTCDGRQSYTFTIDRVRPDFKKAWKTQMVARRDSPEGMVSCYSDAEFGPKLTPVSGLEQLLWDRDRNPGRYTLPIPYEQCVEHGTNWMMNEWPVSPQQVSEAQTALLLCPEHPDAAAIRTRIADQQSFAQELRAGRAFSEGNFKVGAQVAPGTYVTEDVENCYWERLDSAGEIIDNNFALSALRVEVTIASTDFSFNSTGCGTWRQQRS